MRKILYLTVVLLLVNLNLVFAQDSLEFRHVIARNDLMVGGELHLDLEMRIVPGFGSSPRTLHSLTIEAPYGNQITEPASNQIINWEFDFLDGYSQTYSNIVDGDSFKYRILVTAPNVNAGGLPTPPGNPPGWDITTDWQRVCTMTWIISTATSVHIGIFDGTRAAAYFDNYTNAPQGGATSGLINDTDIGDISLPVELTSFTANVSEELDVTLKWVTESEVNNQGFEVFRSGEEEGSYDILSSYTSNNELVGQGNSSAKHTYTYTDQTTMRGNTYWYKIADVDLNGVRNFHGPLSIVVESGNIAGGDDPNFIPDEFQLSQNYPNPFNPETKIRVGIPNDQDIGEITINVFNIMGQKVKTLFQGNLEPGMHTIRWDGKDALGKQVSGGTYFYYLKSNKFHQIKKMILMK